MTDTAVVRKPVSKGVAEKFAGVKMLFKRARLTKTWWCQTDMGMVYGDARLNPEELQKAIDEKDITFNADPDTGEAILDENDLQTYFVGYGVKDETCEIIAKSFSAKASKRSDKVVAKVSKVYEEYDLSDVE